MFNILKVLGYIDFGQRFQQYFDAITQRFVRESGVRALVYAFAQRFAR